MRYTGHYEVNTYPENYNKEQELIRKNFIALSDSRTNQGEWLEHLEDLILRIAYEARDTLLSAGSPSAIQDAITDYHSKMENL